MRGHGCSEGVDDGTDEGHRNGKVGEQERRGVIGQNRERGVNQGLRCLGSPLGQNQMPLRPPPSPD